MSEHAISAPSPKERWNTCWVVRGAKEIKVENNSSRQETVMEGDLGSKEDSG